MKLKGDLYWQQLSMWDCSKKENFDTFSADGFHFELMITTDVLSENQWKTRNIKVDELPQDEINALIPEFGHNWSRVMGNNLSLLDKDK